MISSKNEAIVKWDGHWLFSERWDRDNYIDIIWQNIDRGKYFFINFTSETFDVFLGCE